MRFMLALGLALLASGSTWFYENRVLIARQIGYAAAHNQPRGNLSDLYPRWLGARELLLRGRNPYGLEITREIQQGYYGRPLDHSRPDDPKDQQGFAYPVYVVFLLAPTIGLRFALVQAGFRWLLIATAVATIILWFRALAWRASLKTHLICIVLVLGWWPMVQGIKLQQLSLLVAGLLAAAGACLAGGWLFCAGGLLALATIKPQLVWPLIVWLLLWAGSNWQSRRRFIFGFALVMMLLLGGAEVVLPGWLRMFVQAMAQYHEYTHNQSLLADLLGPVWGRIFALVAALACAVCLYRRRFEPASSPGFGQSFALALALTVIIVSMSAIYNQVLLVPAVLAALRSSGHGEPVPSPVRLLGTIGALLLVWPWMAALGLTAAYPWLTPAIRERVWMMPLYANLLLPVLIFGLTLADTWANHRRVLKRTLEIPIPTAS
jgi:Glycosyltransferase family 87